MAVSLKFNKFQKKSISLPCRSHPSTVRTEEELNKIKASSSTMPSADNICNGLSQLAELYHFMNDLLVLPGTQSLISLHRNAVWVEEVMEGSMKLLDICSVIRDVVLQMEEHIRDLQCALRRRKEQTSIDISIANYNSFRKKMKKDAKGMITSLKQSEKVMGLVADPDNHHLSAVIRVLMEVAEMTVSIFESLLMYISAPVLKPNGWSFMVSKLMHKGTSVACRENEKHKGIMNEFETLDVSLLNILRNGGEETPEIMQIARRRLEGMQVKMKRIESGLECMFRILIKTRASLLNSVSL